MAYKGISAKLPIGQGGFNGTANPSQAGPDQFVFTDGAELLGGIIQKEGGASKVNTVALDSGADIVSGYSWVPVDGTTHQVVFTGTGKVLRDAGPGTFPTTLVTGLVNSTTPPPLFVPAGGEAPAASRKLFMFSANNQVQKVIGTGAVMAAITGPAADWTVSFPTFGCLHAFRMFAGGNASDPHRLYYSQPGDHELYTGSGSGTLSIYPGEGEGIVAAASFNGVLIVWKYPTGIYLIDTSDPVPTNWRVNKVTRSVGTLSQHTVIPIENDTLFLDHVGNVHALSATQEFGDVNTSNVSKEAFIDQFVRDNVNLAQLKRAVGIWYAAKGQAWFALPLGAVADNAIRLIADVKSRSYRYFMSRRDICISMWTHPDANRIPRPTIGDSDGFVWKLDTAALFKDGLGYPITFTTADTDLSFADQSLAYRNKNFEFLEIVTEPSGNFNVNVEVYIDGQLTSVVAFTLGSGGAALGSFVIGTDALSDDFTSNNRQRIAGSGKRIRLLVSNSGGGEAVELAAFYVYFSLGDESTSR